MFSQIPRIVDGKIFNKFAKINLNGSKTRNKIY